jgi:hypothetical protein
VPSRVGWAQRQRTKRECRFSKSYQGQVDWSMNGLGDRSMAGISSRSDAPSIWGNRSREGWTYVFYHDRSRKRGARFERQKRRLSPSRQKLQKRLRIGSAFGLAFGRLEKLERDRSLADGRLKHQRTERTIEHVF